MTQQPELIPMAPGDYLKQKRLARKLSLADVADAVKLDQTLLGNIEEGEVSHLATVYRNGYFRTYARFLNVPEEEIHSLLSSVEVSVEPEIRNIFTEAPKRNPLDQWLRASSYVLASLLIGTLAWQFTHEAVRLSQNGSQLRRVDDGAPGVEAAASQPQVAGLRGPVNASIAPLGALHDKTREGMDTAEGAWAAISKPPASSIPPMADGESHIQISVSADSWVEISDAEGNELEMDLLRAGSEKSYHGTPPFRILFGRAAAVRLSVDGEAVDLTAFTREDVAQLSWPQKFSAGISTSEESGSDDN